MERNLKITKSNEDYLETMYNLERSKGKIRVKDIARKLGVKPPSVVEAVQKLSDNELVSYERYGNINLSKEGIKVAKCVINKHFILKNFLTQIGIDNDTAEEEACALEHVLSISTINKLEEFSEFILYYSDKSEDFMELLKGL